MFGQRDDASENTRQRLLWVFWTGLVVAMAVALVFLSNLLNSVNSAAEQRSQRAEYQRWVALQLDVDLLGLQETLRWTRSEGLKWNAMAVVAVGLREVEDKILALDAMPVSDRYAEENPVVARLSRAQNDFVERYSALKDRNHMPSIETIDAMDSDLTNLATLRKILVQELMQDEVAQSDKLATSTQATLRSVYQSGVLVVIVLVGLLVVNIFMLVTLRNKGNALNQAITNMRSIVEASRDAVFLTREDLTVIGLGKSAETMFGVSETDSLGRRIFEFFVNDRSEFDLFTQALRDISSDPDAANDYRVELNGQRADGSTFPADVGFSVVRDQDGAPAYVISVADMTDQADRELNLMQARNEALQAERAKSRFLSAMSHEMRTPLNGVLASLDLMRETTDLSERQNELAAIIERCGDEALEQVENVLELTRLDSLATTAINVGPFAPSALLREIVEGSANKARLNGNTVRFDSTVPDNLFVTGSAILFRQIMHNFVSNAVKFTSNGEVRVSLRAKDEDGGATCEFIAEVKDTGIGINEEDLERIFRNFETIRDSYSHFRSGTGLGLSIAKHSADLLDGRIEVESVPGQGSTFSLVVSWPKGKTEALNGGVGGVGFAGNDPHGLMDVLVVEDNEINRQMLVDMLQAKGHQVTQAVDGLEGVAAGREKAFDLILMDISMPKLDGVGATRMLRQFGKSRHSPIVAVTAHSQPEHMREFLDAGMDRVLTKPLRMATLEQLFEDMAKEGAKSSVAPLPEPAAKVDVLAAKETEDTSVVDVATVSLVEETARASDDAPHSQQNDPALVVESPQEPDQAKQQKEVDIMADDLIEKDVFDGLIDMLGGESVIGYVAQFESDAQSMLPVYRDAINAGDFAAARAEAHRCAGGAAVIGAAKVHEVLQEMTHAADANDAEKCGALADSLPGLTNATMTAMRSVVG